MNRFAFASVFLLATASCGHRDRDEPGAGRIRVDAQGPRLEFLIEGADRGRPTVILESGLGGRIDGWTTVRESLAGITRVVSYHRAGTGGSQPGPRPRTAGRIVSELRAALRSLEIAPPYILVGHSVGGLYVRAFAGQHPDEVLRLVLVDPTMEFRESLTGIQVETRLQQYWGSRYARTRKLLDRVHPRMAAIAAQSILELEAYLQTVPLADQQPTRVAWLELFEDRSQRIEGMQSLFSDAERQELFASMESMRFVRALPAEHTPVTLLIAGRTASQSRQQAATKDPLESADYVAWSQNVRLMRYTEYIETIPDGRMEILHDAGHDVPEDRPDAIINAVRSALEL